MSLPALFQSTPSVWRETRYIPAPISSIFISIHSLRVEGDRSGWIVIQCIAMHFNPLPPCGGRHSGSTGNEVAHHISIHSLRVEGDDHALDTGLRLHISIHSLRVEGDLWSSVFFCWCIRFQSTPSVWRETLYPIVSARAQSISIHSLRVEGDLLQVHHLPSTHHFNPLPPCGGRPFAYFLFKFCSRFQSTPSVWRETSFVNPGYMYRGHFNPLPPCGGRRQLLWALSLRLYFNPLPPCGGRQQNYTAFRLKLSRANAILTKKNTDTLLHVRKNTFFLIFLRKSGCESLLLFLCA